MCGRFDQHTLPYRYAGYIDALLRTVPEEPAPRYNVAPQTQAWVGRMGRDGQRELVPLLWGLLPYQAEDPKTSLRPINARSESVATKPMFRKLIEMHRCVIPVDGFYEWRATPSGKQPYYVRLESGEPMLLAGLWDRWRRGDATQVETFAVLTTDASPAIARLHDRMPALIEPADLNRWLDVRGTDAATARAMLRPSEARLTAHPVSRLVNAARNEGPELIEPAPADWDSRRLEPPDSAPQKR